MNHAADPIWYVAYGSNLSATRFACYLSGGRPPGARLANRGARDPQPPAADSAVVLNGQVYFTGTSAMWGGAVAFFDPLAPGSALARSYLLTTEQFVDVMAQEMGGEPGGELSLPQSLASGDRIALGPGPYGTLVVCGERDGIAMVTFTAPWAMADAVPDAPSLSYLAVLAAGLGESHGLGVRARAAYLAGLRGAGPRWDTEGLAAALHTGRVLRTGRGVDHTDAS